VSSLIARIGSSGNPVALPPDVLLRAFDEVEIDDTAQVFITEGIQLRSDPRAHTAFLTTNRVVAREVGLQPGEQAILVNGRVRRPFVSHESVYDKPHA